MKQKTEEIKYTRYKENIICDSCGLKRFEDDNDDTTNNQIEGFDISFLRTSDSWTGQTSYDSWRFDICEKCFVDKILPTIKKVVSNIDEDYLD